MALVLRAAEQTGPAALAADAGGSTAIVLRGDKAVVAARRKGGLRKRTAAEIEEDELIEQAASVARPAIDRAVLESDVSQRASLATMNPKSAEHLRYAEKCWDEFCVEYNCVPSAGSYPAVRDVKCFAASMTRSRKRVCLAHRDEDGPAPLGVAQTSSRNWLRQVRAARVAVACPTTVLLVGLPC